MTIQSNEDFEEYLRRGPQFDMTIVYQCRECEDESWVEVNHKQYFEAKKNQKPARRLMLLP